MRSNAHPLLLFVALALAPAAFATSWPARPISDAHQYLANVAGRRCSRTRELFLAASTADSVSVLHRVGPWQWTERSSSLPSVFVDLAIDFSNNTSFVGVYSQDVIATYPTNWPSMAEVTVASTGPVPWQNFCRVGLEPVGGSPLDYTRRIVYLTHEPTHRTWGNAITIRLIANTPPLLPREPYEVSYGGTTTTSMIAPCEMEIDSLGTMWLAATRLNLTDPTGAHKIELFHATQTQFYALNLADEHIAEVPDVQMYALAISETNGEGVLAYVSRSPDNASYLIDVAARDDLGSWTPSRVASVPSASAYVRDLALVAGKGNMQRLAYAIEWVHEDGSVATEVRYAERPYRSPGTDPFTYATVLDSTNYPLVNARLGKLFLTCDADSAPVVVFSTSEPVSDGLGGSYFDGFGTIYEARRPLGTSGVDESGGVGVPTVFAWPSVLKMGQALHVEWQAPMSQEGEVALFDVGGRSVAKRAIRVGDRECELQLDSAASAPGVLFGQLRSNGEIKGRFRAVVLR